MSNIVDKIKTNKYYLAMMIIIPMLDIFYELIDRLSRVGTNLAIEIDTMIPFISSFILPYVYWYIYVYLGLVFILFNDKKSYIKAVVSMIVGLCICYLIFYFFPTEIARPVVAGDGVINSMVNLVYNNDKPVNCFPSIHVLKTYLVMRFTRVSYSKPWFIYTNLIGVLIILSTIFVKQHFLVDIVGSIILCEIIMFLLEIIFKKRVDIR